ncbi:hypothetical protein ACGF12_30330 [Kitasatospora sp. NPDC048296]|uniref:hypothetical protein n=1 Tax=Kitasatospora sp. NPDC048296 TaxID=3364048 RepID=UPI003719679F
MSKTRQTLTINDLRVTLANLMIREGFSPDTPVVLSSDPEGNHYGALDGFSDVLYADDTVYSLPGTQESQEEREFGHVPPQHAVKVVALYPRDPAFGPNPFSLPAED